MVVLSWLKLQKRLLIEEILEKKLDEKLRPIVQTVNELKDSL
jgi:hypothetical protein